MTWQSITALMLVILGVLMVLYDLTVYALGGNDATISRVALNASEENRALAVVVACLFGILLGHLFLPQHVK